MNGIIKLYKNHRELLLVEITYLIVMLLAFAVAGIIALFNQSFGVAALVVPLVALIALLMNIVAWAIIKLVLEHLVAWYEKTHPTAKNSKDKSKK